MSPNSLDPTILIVKLNTEPQKDAPEYFSALATFSSSCWVFGNKGVESNAPIRSLLGSQHCILPWLPHQNAFTPGFPIINSKWNRPSATKTSTLAPLRYIFGAVQPKASPPESDFDWGTKTLNPLANRRSELDSSGDRYLRLRWMVWSKRLTSMEVGVEGFCGEVIAEDKGEGRAELTKNEGRQIGNFSD